MLASTRARWFWAGLVVLLVGLGGPIATWRPEKAEAHPLGNFTINRYSRIELSPSGIHLRYVVDMAEIPTFQEHAAIDQDGNGRIDAAEQSVYLQQKADTLRQGVALKISDSTVELRAVSSELSFPPGQGGLDTERIVIDYAAPMPSGWQSSALQVEYRDKNYEERIGWREIVAVPLDGVRLANSSVSSTDVSDELRAYPKNAIANPLNVSRASFEFTSTLAGSSSSTTVAVPATHSNNQARAIQGNPDSPLARYAQLIAKDRLSVSVIMIALLAAIGFGALHALSPGHGKTIVGAYLVGSRGTWRHALLLSLTVTVTHTSSVYALGFVTLYLSAFIVPEKLYPWLSIASGGLILAMGLMLLVSRLRTSRLLGDAWVWLKRGLPVVARPQLALDVAGVGHIRGDHSILHAQSTEVEVSAAPPMHSHGLGPAHSHAPPGAAESTLTWRGLIGLGVFGGLLPCPSAIVVMLSAIALHRVALGLVLIVAFSFGLATVLTTIGLLLVCAGSISRRLPFVSAASSRLGDHAGVAAFAVRAFPVASAAAVLVAGLVITAHGLSQQGLL
jgi:nickel/cobalt exporter